ncbi:MAG: hypothetical protein ACK500_13435 [Flavobacteriales bacterium]
MIRINLNLKTALAVSVLTVSSALFTGCQKEQEFTGLKAPQKKVTVNADQQRMLQDMAGRVPTLRIYDEDDNRFIDIDLKNRNFSFSEPNDGWNLSSSDDVVWEPADGGGGILFIGAGAFGGNTGGTIVAGSTALNINYTFCFAASEEALGLDLFDTGANIDGISGVIGIAGDFEALLNDEVDEDSDFTDYFQGFAAYFVYDNEASGSYEILDWLSDLDADLSDLEGNGFGYVFGFENFSLYFSYSGTLNVSGGSIGFNGEYLGFENLDELFFNFDDEEEPEIDIVPGFGVMGC